MFSGERLIGTRAVGHGHRPLRRGGGGGGHDLCRRRQYRRGEQQPGTPRETPRPPTLRTRSLEYRMLQAQCHDHHSSTYGPSHLGMRHGRRLIHPAPLPGTAR